jgi:catechol 2,3-dioxygenase-like lactoylglutathione lyase family enzyme
MPLPLDHIVIAVNDLAQASADYRELGFNVLPGGEHPGRTSHNALVVFSDGTYLELIAWQGPATNERWYNTLQAHGEGLVDFALLPDDTATALAAARARGLLTLHGPVDGGRVRPDGERLQWQSARHETPDVPFLCGDVTPRRLRVPDDPASRTHGNGATGVASVCVALHDLDQGLQRYQALLGPETVFSKPTVVSGLGLRTAIAALPGLKLVLTEPVAGDESAPARELRERLATRGEGPCAFTLSASSGLRMLDEALTHGVAIELG